VGDGQRGGVPLAHNAQHPHGVYASGALQLALRFTCVLSRLICRWQVIPLFNVDVTGFDAVWSIRTGMQPIANGPLDLHAQFSEYVTGNTVVALSTLFSRRWEQRVWNLRPRLHTRIAFTRVHWRDVT
jgi:hypothetical protein